MDLDEILNEWTKDSKIDPLKLDDESIKIPQLHNKYIKIYSNKKIKYRFILEKKKELISLKEDYYNGRLNNTEELERLGLEPFEYKLTKNGVERHIQSDKEIINTNLKIIKLEEELSTLESILKELNNRNWEIRNSIEWQKFLQGS